MRAGLWWTVGVVAAAAAAVTAVTLDPEQVTVAHVVDGDTVVLEGGRSVRLIGIDSPERGECGYRGATEALAARVEGRPVRLVNPRSVQDEDRFGRWLRYVEVDHADAGRAQIAMGHAAARYDSRDGYDPHPRERDYRDTDAATRPRCRVR